MKKLILATLGLTCAVSVFAQGTVQLNNHFTGGFSYVWYNSAINTQIVGGDTADTPAGTYTYVANGFAKISGNSYMAAFLSASGAGVAESALSFGATPTSTTFRTGAAAGIMALQTATLGNVAADAASATLELFVWNTSGGTYTTAQSAYNAWKSGLTLGGLSGAFTVNAIGGVVNTAPTPAGLTSFNVYLVPEPTTMALAGLGAAALLIFRRRK